MVGTPRHALSYGGIGLLCGLFLLLDVLLPVGLTVELLQVAVVLLTLFLPGRRPTWLFGVVATGCVGVGYVTHFGLSGPVEALLNRGLVLAGLWLAVAVVLRYKQVVQARYESEARAQAILETTADGILTIDPDGRIESFNPAAEEIFGYDADDVIGEDVSMLMPRPPRDTPVPDEAPTIGIGREVTGRRRDGSTFPLDLAVSEVGLDDRTLYTGIVRDISERRRLEKEILNVTEQERRRIGQDLHDGLGQMLTGIGLLCQDVAQHLAEEGHERADDLAEITEHVKEADAHARDLSHGLIPVHVDANGLVEALRRLTDDTERLYDVSCAFRETGTPLVHNNTAATHLYRIAQEAVNNAVTHGAADRISIALAGSDEHLRLRVRDDGTGFDPQSSSDSGMGVRIMNYRARIIGGSLDVRSTPNEGTVVTCTLPRTAYAADALDPAPDRPVPRQ